MDEGDGICGRCVIDLLKEDYLVGTPLKQIKKKFKWYLGEFVEEKKEGEEEKIPEPPCGCLCPGCLTLSSPSLPPSLSWLSEAFWIDDETQQLVYEEVVTGELALRFPPSGEYRKKFLKEYVNYLTLAKAAINDEIMEECMSFLLPSSIPISFSSTPEEKEMDHKTYHFPSLSLLLSPPCPHHPSMASSPLISCKRGVEGGCGRKRGRIEGGEEQFSVTTRASTQFSDIGFRFWEAGYILAEFCLANPDIFQNKHVYELGTGTGFTGCVVGKGLGGKENGVLSLTLSDYSPSIVANIAHNIAMNELSDKVKAEEADWQSWEPPTENCDIMIGADLTYDNELVRLLVKVINSFLGKRDTSPPSSTSLEPPLDQRKVIIISTIRRPETYAYFKQLLKESNRYIATSSPPPVYLSYTRPPKFEILNIW